MTTKEQREIIEAYERGEEIEITEKGYTPQWQPLNMFCVLDNGVHQFNFEKYDYRIKKRWRAEKGKAYIFLDATLTIREDVDENTNVDYGRYCVGNYFHTLEEAQKAKELLIKTLTKFNENE